MSNPKSKATHLPKLLFVCSRNRRRSPTAEQLVRSTGGYEARSAGTQPGARIALTAGLIGWADTVFFMEKSHLNRARLRFADALQDKEIVTLHIPDDYEFMQPELIDVLQAKLAGWLDSDTE